MYIVDFAKNLFRKANAGVIAYLVLNIGLYVSAFGGFSALGNAIIALLLYFATLCVALSPIGEWILRFQTGCKEIKRTDYLDRLMPLFDEVYDQAKALDPSISAQVKLYMSADTSPNAFATGRRTICITKGFMSYTDGQIKGTLAHEFAHLAHKDTDLLLLIQVGNFLISAIFIIFRIFANILVLIFANALNLKFIGTFLTSLFVNGILSILMWLWTKAGLLLVMRSSRENEYEADAFAADLGYGNDLCVVLDSISGGEATAGRSLWAQLHSSHPKTDDRIARLQAMGAGYNNRYGHDVRAVNANPEQYGYSHSAPPVPPPAGTGYQRPRPGARPAPVPAAAAAFVSKARGMLTHEPEPSAAAICLHCGGVIEDGDAFCGECGKPYTPPPVNLVCPNCEAELPLHKKFCTKCGTPVTPPESAPVTPPESAPVTPPVQKQPEPTPPPTPVTSKPAPPPPPPKPEPLLCKSCGLELEPDDTFCSVCGTAVSASKRPVVSERVPPAPTQVPPPPERQRLAPPPPPPIF